MNTAREARPARVVVHFWPGQADFNAHPDAVLPCKGLRPSPAATSRFFHAVTCKRCRSSRVFKAMAVEFATSGGCTFTVPALVEWGFLPVNARPPVERPAPYRNPNLTRDPLENMLIRWEELAAGAHSQVGGPLIPEAKQVYAQCAHEARTVLATLKRGGL